MRIRITLDRRRHAAAISVLESWPTGARVSDLVTLWMNAALEKSTPTELELLQFRSVYIPGEQRYERRTSIGPRQPERVTRAINSTPNHLRNALVAWLCNSAANAAAVIDELAGATPPADAPPPHPPSAADESADLDMVSDDQGSHEEVRSIRKPKVSDFHESAPAPARSSRSKYVYDPDTDPTMPQDALDRLLSDFR